MRWTAAAFVAVIMLALRPALKEKEAWGQTSTGLAAASKQNQLSAQTLEGSGSAQPPPVSKAKPSDANAGQSKSGSSDTKGENSQMPFSAFGNNNRGPINIQSDSLALDYKQNTVVFSGSVHATQADAALTGRTLNVKYGKDFHEVQNMVAEGDVRISQGVRWCTSDRAVMDQGRHTVTLTGSPVCHDARDQITGTRITVHLDTSKSDVEGAKAVIFPQTSKTRDNEALADHAK
jgi:lipopolysaccharide export system protein LptA